MFLLVERIFAIVVQVGLTLLGALAVVRRRFAWLILAILVHALINVPAASYQYGFLELHHGEMIYALLLLAAIYFIRVQGASVLKFVKFSLDESKAAE